MTNPPGTTEKNNRQILRDDWVAPRSWYKIQPIHTIRWYFGEQIGFYFSWLGFYTAWLVVPIYCWSIIFHLWHHRPSMGRTIVILVIILE